MFKKTLCAILILAAVPLSAQPNQAPTGRPDIAMPPDIGAAYGRLGKAMMAQDVEGVKTVWAEDFVVNAPNNAVLDRDGVIAAMRDELLAYKDFKKTIRYVGNKGDAVIVMGTDSFVPVKGPGAGKHVTRPFTDVWMKRADRWMLVARQATIAAVE